MGSRKDKRIKYALGALVDRAASTLVRLNLLGPRERAPFAPLPENPRFLLLILDHLGDAVLATALPAALVERFPSAEVHVLTRPSLAMLFDPLQGVTGVRLEQAPWFESGARWLDPCYWLSLSANLRWIRRNRFDAILDLRGDLRQLLLFGGFTRPRLLLGQLRAGGKQLVSVVLPYDPSLPELQKKLALVEALGHGAPQAARPRIELGEAEREAGRAELSRLRKTRPSGLLLVDPGGKPVQRWPLDRFAQLVGRLLGTTDLAIALSGAPGMESELADLADRAAAGSGPEEAQRLALLPPAVHVRALAARVAAADLVLSADTGIALLAGALSVPAITLFGPTDPMRFWFGAPPGRPLRSPKPCCREELHEACSLRPGTGPGLCMQALPVDEVLEAVLALFSPDPASPS